MTQIKQPDNSALSTILTLSEGNRFVADGPLGLVFSKALDEVYKKEVDVETGIAIESQANDTIVDSAWLLAATQSPSEDFNQVGNEVGMLYGITQNHARISDVVNVSNVLSEMSPEQKARSAIIIDTKVEQPVDGSPSTVVSEVVNPFDQALESIALYHGVRVHPSLEAFLQALPQGARA